MALAALNALPAGDSGGGGESGGVFAFEFFVSAVDGQIVLNEIAPRVHNSAHYTIEACVTDQVSLPCSLLCSLLCSVSARSVFALLSVSVLLCSLFCSALLCSALHQRMHRMERLK